MGVYRHNQAHINIVENKKNPATSDDKSILTMFYGEGFKKTYHEKFSEGNSVGIGQALKKIREIASQSDVRTDEEREYQVNEYAAAAALGLDLYDGETEIDVDEKEEDLYESEKNDAIALSLKDDGGEALMDFLEQIEIFWDTEHDPKRVTKHKHINPTGDQRVKRILADTGIILPY